MQHADFDSKNLIQFPEGGQGRSAHGGLELPEWLLKTLGTLRLWRRRMRERAELRDILNRDWRFFADIGVPRGTIVVESRKWFWEA